MSRRANRSNRKRFDNNQKRQEQRDKMNHQSNLHLPNQQQIDRALAMQQAQNERMIFTRVSVAAQVVAGLVNHLDDTEAIATKVEKSVVTADLLMERMLGVKFNAPQDSQPEPGSDDSSTPESVSAVQQDV